MTIVKRALLSVSDKTGLVEFATALSSLSIELVSTGGTRKLLEEAGVPVRDISDLTGFPEMMDGRVKTLHPKVHGGILARRDDAAHIEAMQAHDIVGIEMVVVNLYPFEEVSRKADVTLPELIENIDIGGPSMIRSAAKNNKDVTIVVSPDDYTRVLSSLQDGDTEVEDALRFELAVKAYKRTAEYDTHISQTLAAYVPSATT